MSPSLRPWLLVLGAALCLIAATPPAWFAGASFRVLPGLALQFAVARSDRWPRLGSYLLGVVHMAVFSWSLHHVLLGAWLAVALLGGLYYLAVAVLVRAVRPSLGPLVFAVAVAGASWLRAEMPEISYPHGQPCHSLWQYPWLLGAVRLGGEPLANALLAGLAATAVVGLGGAWRQAAGALALCVGVTLLGAPTPRSESQETVDVLAVEPGLHILDPFFQGTAAQWRRSVQQRVEENLWRPTVQAAGPDAADPPALVLWPESSLPGGVIQDPGGGLRLGWLPPGFGLAADTRLLVGTDQQLPDGQRAIAALLLDARGRPLDLHQKQRLVPGGEFVPFVSWLPESVADWIGRTFEAALGFYPRIESGLPREPLETAAGVKFAGLVCYDNAFPGPVAEAVRRGAQFVAVLSNEAWYRGGGELAQLAAITVIRAVAADVSIFRCTIDGWTMAVDRDGRILDQLDPASGDTGPRVLRVKNLPLRNGQGPPALWLHSALGWLAAGALLLGCLHGLARWVRLLRPGPPDVEMAGVPLRSAPPKGGS
ncbi:MAG: apolipoprotein N-acyltransferase [Planctomycetota bacterium]|nr:apolipoprotein N-acyltransferase [Planctomycetota bacterium]